MSGGGGGVNVRGGINIQGLIPQCPRTSPVSYHFSGGMVIFIFSGRKSGLGGCMSFYFENQFNPKS